MNAEYKDDRLVCSVGGLEIWTTDEKGLGGAHHHYSIVSAAQGPRSYREIDETLHFQKGGIPTHGLNGITNEVLLTIVQDRLLSFQNGSFPCEDNQKALDAVTEALAALYTRTAERRARGVEGQIKA